MQILDKLKKISLRGRIAFTIMCIEQYLTKQYPHKNWTPLSEKMWKVTNSYFDEWLYNFTDIMPECFFETSELKNESETIAFKKLYKDLTEDDINDINELLNLLVEIVELHVYTDAFSMEKESLNDILTIISDYLIKNKICVPDIEKVSFSKVEENDGFGKKFNGTYLSIILNNN